MTIEILWYVAPFIAGIVVGVFIVAICQSNGDDAPHYPDEQG